MPISNPTDVSNCVVWLDATDLSSLYSDTLGTIPIIGNDEEYIKCWKDKTTGKLFTNSDIGVDGPRYSPTFYSNPTIRFLSTNARDTGFTANFVQPYRSCMVFVVARTDISSSRRLYTHAYSGATAITNLDIWTPLSQSTNTIRNFYNTNLGQTLGFSLSTFNVFNSYIDNDVDNGFSVGVGVNGNYSVSDTVNVLLQDSKPMVTHSVGKNCLGTSSNDNFLGYIGEVVVYDKMLNPEEIQQVENYLCLKWLGRKSNTTAAKSSGNWFTPSIWLDDSLPESHQIVYGGDKEIIIDGNIAVNRLSNANLIPKNYVSNGKFILNDNYNIRGDIQNATAQYTENCLEILTPSGVVELSGNILEIVNSTDQRQTYERYRTCVLHRGNCDLKIYGDIGSGRLDHFGIYHDSEGTLTVHGTVYSSQGTSSAIYLPPKNNIGKVIIYGNVFGGGGIDSGNNGISNNSSNTSVNVFGNVASRSDGAGLFTTSSGIHTIYGNVSASSGGREGKGLNIQGPSTVYVYGDIFADNVDTNATNVAGSIAIFNNSLLSNLYIYGNIYNKGFKRSSPNLNARLDVSQAIVSRKLNTVNPGNSTFYRKTTAIPSLSFWALGNYNLSLLPPLSDTIIGYPYAQGPIDNLGITIPVFYGQMKIPSREVVRVNEIIGTQRGIAVFQPNDLQHIWDCDFEDIAINNNTTADYIIKLMSTEEMGEIISENNP
jgi:hypothetical protein